MIYDQSVTGIIDQGDILYPITIKEFIPWWLDDKKYPVVILTPTCDLIQLKADHHRIGVLEPFPLFFLRISKEILGTEKIDFSIISPKQKQKIEDKLRNAIRNSWPRYHFLSKDENLIKTDRIIDFEVIFSVPIESIKEELRIARIKSPFKEELIHRYSHHTMRIGTPDIDKSKINAIIDSCFSLAFQGT
jgi:hypothetical protein